MRGILTDESGKTLCEASIPTPLAVDAARGTFEQRPDAYTAGVTAICRDLAARHPVDAVSVSAFRSAPTLVDRDGNALCNFIMWQDTRNSAICKRLSYANEAVYRATGASINTVFTASKITWLKENAPDVYKRAYKAMIVPDYVVHFMTGAFVTDRTYGSRTSLMNIERLEWDAELCALFNVDAEKLCDLVDQGTVVGRVREAFARLTGIAVGTPVVSAGGDQQCGALGLGVTDTSTIEVNSGTGSFVISVTDAPYLENPRVICNVAATPGKYILEMNILATASALNWLIREYFPEYGGDAPDYGAVNRAAELSPPGARGLICVPHFQGCGARDWNPQARAGFWGFSLASRKDDMIRALYEGIAAEIAKNIDVLPQACRSATSIAVAGGLSRSDVYNQILCDMTGRTLTRRPNAQATAMGAFVSAAVALGCYPDSSAALNAARAGEGERVYAPDAGIARLYAGVRDKTERLYRAARDLND